jgi:hypothetical protein
MVASERVIKWLYADRTSRSVRFLASFQRINWVFMRKGSARPRETNQRQVFQSV